jgi:hypothetical protein
MNTLPFYIFGYCPEVKAAIAMRRDAHEKAIQDLRDEFGQSIHGLNFGVFASVEFAERKGNDFGRAFYRYNEKGEGTQIRKEETEYGYLYSFLHMACAQAVDQFLRKDGTYWPRLMVWRLSERNDVAQLLEASGIVKASVAA